MVLDGIYLENDEPLVQQVKLLVGVKQIVVLTTLVVRFQHVEESVNIKIFLTDFLFFQHLAVFRSHKLIEGIEARHDVAFLFQFTDVERHGI